MYGQTVYSRRKSKLRTKINYETFPKYHINTVRINVKDAFNFSSIVFASVIFLDKYWTNKLKTDDFNKFMLFVTWNFCCYAPNCHESNQESLERHSNFDVEQTECQRGNSTATCCGVEHIWSLSVCHSQRHPTGADCVAEKMPNNVGEGVDEQKKRLLIK